jgi:hypothetical protein
LPRKKKKTYSRIKLKNAKSFDDLSPDIAIRIERGAGGRTTLRYANETICTEIFKDNDENKPWGYVTIAKPNEYEGNCGDVYIARVIESDKKWGPLLLKIAIEWASKNSDGLVADRFRVTEFEYHLWDHMLGDQGGDIDLKPIAPCMNKSTNIWMERLGLKEDETATSYVYSSKTDMLRQLLKSKRIC